MEFLRAYPWAMFVVLVLAQNLVIYLLWPRPVRGSHYLNMFTMFIATTAIPLLYALIASEVFK